jgi:hypothetical protein
VVAPRSDGVTRTAKYQAALEGGHDVLVLISEVWGGFSPEAMRFLGELSWRRRGIDIERASTTWSTSSFTSYHGQLLSLAVQWRVAIEIERAIKKNASFQSAHGALETLAPGPPAGVLNSGRVGLTSGHDQSVCRVQYH